MKTVLVPLIGDYKENLYQLGIKEKESFHRLEEKITGLLSANNFLRYGQDILSRARALLKKKDDSFFDQCIESIKIDNFFKRHDIRLHFFDDLSKFIEICRTCARIIIKVSDVVSRDTPLGPSRETQEKE